MPSDQIASSGGFFANHCEMEGICSSNPLQPMGFTSHLEMMLLLLHCGADDGEVEKSLRCHQRVSGEGPVLIHLALSRRNALSRRTIGA